MGHLTPENKDLGSQLQVHAVLRACEEAEAVCRLEPSEELRRGSPSFYISGLATLPADWYKSITISIFANDGTAALC